jgi:dinuclear metal center YbgI/SA1388 family protein
MTIGELYQKLEELYTRSLSCPWDNDGLMLCPNPNRAVTRVMLALDATKGSIEAAAQEKCELLLTHHPMLFRPLRSLTPLELSGSRVLQAYRGEVSVISLHTRLDAGRDGVNDALARKLGLTVCGVFGDDESPELGRIAELERTCDPLAFAEHVRAALGCDAVHLTGRHPVQRIAMVGGDGKDFIRAAMKAGADTFITGAAGYNMALDAAEEGLNIIEAGHYHTEAPVLEHLADLCRAIAGAQCFFYDSNPTRTVTGK